MTDERTGSSSSVAEQALADANRQRTLLLAREPSSSDGRDLLDIELTRVRLTAVLPGETATRNKALVEASASGHAAAIAAVRESGSVELMVDGTPRLFPARRTPLLPDPWLAAWGAAVITRDAAALSALTSTELIAALGETAGAFWTPVARALSTLVSDVGDQTRITRLGIAEAAVIRAEPPAMDPSYRKRMLLPLLAVARKAVRDNASGERPSVAASMPVGRAALGRPASADGISAPADDGLPPVHRRDAAAVSESGRVCYHYPSARLHRAEEVTWFLDLEGFPRIQRSHWLSEVGGRLWATYAARGAPGLPEATISVEPAPVGERFAPSAQDLLDVGDLVLAADLLGRRADDRSPLPDRRAWLDEACDCIAEVRARLRSTRSNPEDLVFTARGRACLRAEPGRFSPERLEALEGTWRDRVRAWDQELGVAAARDSALDSITLLRLQLDPILHAIGADRTGGAARALRPRPEDYARVFVASTVAVARSKYEEFWGEPLKLAFPSGAQTQVLTHVAPAGMLADDNELSWRFPGGYRWVAQHLQPERVWAAWKYVVPGATSGLAYDGLVWCEDHWSWFPRPYRVLRDLLNEPAQ